MEPRCRHAITMMSQWSVITTTTTTTTTTVTAVTRDVNKTPDSRGLTG